MTSAPASLGHVALSGSTAGTIAKPAGEIPRTSNAIAIVLAVNWPPQAPAPGEATSSISVSSLVGDLAGGVGADGLEHLLDGDALAVEVAGQDRAAVEHHAGDVEPAQRHHGAGDRLVAPADAR